MFRNGSWFIDDNQNGYYDATDATAYFGAPGDVPVLGDWNGDGIDEIGVFRNGTWYLDVNGDGIYNAGDATLVFGQAGDLPVVGEWDGTGRDRIGVFRNGYWYLDSNGSGAYDAGDATLVFGTTGDQPVVGDWAGVDQPRIGVYRNGTWYLDSNGSGAYDAGDATLVFGGTPGDMPVIGDWNSDGVDDIAVYSAGQFYYDSDGSGTYNAGDQTTLYGQAGDIAVAGTPPIRPYILATMAAGQTARIEYEARIHPAVASGTLTTRTVISGTAGTTTFTQSAWEDKVTVGSPPPTQQETPDYIGRYGYTGREWEAEIDLQFNRGRYYDPATGRWISQDPLGFDAGDSNLYRYVHNRPTGATDPSGLQSWGQVGGEVSGAAAAVGPWKLGSRTFESGAESYQPRLLFLKGAQPSPADIKRFLLDSDRAKIQRRKEMGYPLPGQSGSATKIPRPVPTHLLTLQEMYARAQDDSWGYRTKYLPRLNQGQTATGDALDSGTVRIPTPERESFEAETRWWTDAYVEHILQPDYHQNAQAIRRPYKHILDHGGDTLGGIEREVRWLLGPLPRPVGARLSPGVQFAKTVVAGMLTLLGLDFFVDGFEASSGEDFITGAPLTPGQKAFSGLASTTPFVAALWLRRAENAADFNPLARHADDLPPRHLDPIPGGGSYGAGAPAAPRIVRGTNSSRVTFDGMEVRAIRDLSHLDEGTLRAMQQRGFAATDINGQPLQLHHLGQNPAGPLVEIPAPAHNIANRVQHPYGNQPGAGLTAEQRTAFNDWRTRYWQERAREELARRGLQ